jgi:peptidoglycan hydrolase-like protein with peptidoglycan-binding domain
MSRRARVVALAAVVAVLAAAVTIVLTQSGGHTANAAGSGIPAGFTTATVERRTLTERSTVDGTLGYAGTGEMYDRLAGTYTWLPAVGATIARGGTLFKVNNDPIVLMYGPVPAYRALKEGVSDGPDVEQLNSNLDALGYGAIIVDAHFGEATAAAVRRWQHAEGLTETGEVELGRVVFAPGARRVTDVHVVLGQDPPGNESESGSPSSSGTPSGSGAPSGSSSPSGSSNPSDSGSNKQSSLKQPSGSKNKPKSKPNEGKSGKGSPSSGNDGSGSHEKEGASEKKGSGEKDKENSGAGGKEGSGGAGGAPVLVLSTTGNAQIVTLQLKATQQELAHVGESVPVQLPDGQTVNGHVSEVGTVASESSGEGGNGGSGGKGGAGGNEGGNGENATIAVKVTLDRPVAHLDKAPVSVELVKAIRHHVLAVPATSLVATGGGNFAVQALEGNRRVEIAVTPGMFANGYVQVEGSGLSDGMTVLQPQ